jgi:nucleoside recognition membrane protein YjiH
MYEHKKQPLATTHMFYQRVLKNLLFATGILLICLLIGLFGYHFLANAPWIDALHNAAMILSGMGPVIQIDSTAGKLFSSVYALFSGVVFIANIGFILAPAIHRLFHRLHLEEK